MLIINKPYEIVIQFNLILSNLDVLPFHHRWRLSWWIKQVLDLVLDGLIHTLEVQVAEHGLDYNDVLVGILVNFLGWFAYHWACRILASFDSPAHPRILSVVIIVNEHILLIEIRAVVLAIVIHICNFLVQIVIFTLNKRDIYRLVIAVLIRVNVKFHLKIWIVVIIEILVQNLWVQMEITRIILNIMPKVILLRKIKVIDCLYNRILLPHHAVHRFLDSKRQNS